MECSGHIPKITGRKCFCHIKHKHWFQYSVKSIVQCVKMLLNSGVPFVLTHCFNQDPLEQHFGHYRHKGGSNNNLWVIKDRHRMNQLQTVGTEGS